MKKINKNLEKKKVEKTISAFEILLMVVSILTFAYFIGQDFVLVSAAMGGTATTTPDTDVEVPDGLEESNTEEPAGKSKVVDLVFSFGGGVATDLVTSFLRRKLFGEVAVQGAANAQSAALAEAGGTVTTQVTGVFGAIASNMLAAFAAAAAVAIIIGLLIGADERNIRSLVGSGLIGAGAGSVVGIVIAVSSIAGPVGWVATAVITALITLGVALARTTQYSRDYFIFQPGLWQPVDGGAKCEECNDLPFGCSEYQCRSYGKACELKNPGSEFKTCVWDDPLDFEPPLMFASQDELLTMRENLGVNLDYVESEVVLPPELGVKINNNDDIPNGCIPPYSEVNLGLDTDEPAECRIDIKRGTAYEQMSPMDQGTYLVYNHTLFIPGAASPSSSSLGVVAQNGLNHEFFISCKDANGNEASANFIMEFCVDQSPDINAPNVLSASLDNSYIKQGVTSAEVDFMTNEPATCKWDYSNKDYNDMFYNMDYCPTTSPGYFNPDENPTLVSYNFGCRTNITGLKDSTNNLIYVRCKDKPWICDGSLADADDCDGTGDGESSDGKDKRYKMTSSKVVTIKGSSGLAISRIRVEGQENNILVKDSTDPVKVKLEVDTIGGAEKTGLAKCDYISGEIRNSFYNNGNVLDYLPRNTQDLHLSEGDYTYDIECRDKGGNTDTKTISFRVEIDKDAPIVIRAYNEGSKLKIVTNEKADCVYDTANQNYVFGDGIAMSSVDGISHLADWDTTNYLYIKCKDEFGNQPKKPTDTTMTLRPF